MQYRLDFFNIADQLTGYVVFEARDDEAALDIGDGLALAASDRRVELLSGERVVKVYSVP